MPSPRMNPRIQLAVRQPECANCKMSREAQGLDRCVTAVGDHEADILVVGKNPFSDRMLKEIHTYLERAGFDPTRMAFSGAVKCRAWDLQPSNSDVKTCRSYVNQEIEFIKPTWVLALGNEALLSTTGKSGITKHRGVTYPGPHGVKVVSTISPSMVHRNPGLKGGFEADLLYLHKLTEGRNIAAENRPLKYRVASSKDKLKEMIRDVKNAGGVSFDIESTGFDEFDPDSRIVCIAFTLWGNDDETPQMTWALPLFHPESPWAHNWRAVFQAVGKSIQAVPKRIAHNGKFDSRWCRHFGWPIIAPTFDTMIAAHTLDENRPKGLKPLSRELLSAPPWAMDTKDLLNEPLKQVLKYCGLDTHHAARLYFLFRAQLNEQVNAKKKALFSHLMMPAANEFIATERAGVWVDREQMMTNWHIAQKELDDINESLMEWVPENWASYGHKAINFGPSNFLKWLLFEYLELRIVARGKSKDDGKLGSPSVAEAVMLELKEDHPIIPILLERTKWYKYTTAFFSAYAEQLDSNSRIHTTFKVTGTVTGRLSSGKADADKVTGRKQIRGVNLQQVPRDKFVRGIFGAPPGSSFVEFDYSQVELRIAAYLSREQTMLGLYAQGHDIHTAMAMRLMNKPQAEITVHERKMAKAVNFGFLYGMGATKFMATALSNYGLNVKPEDAQAARTAFFDQFPGLLPWHAQQRRLAMKFKRVESPMGRVRHLPDIDSPSREVKAEAERQAINSPVQAFASDLALLSFVMVSRKLRAGKFKTHPIGTVHDAINFEVPNEELPTVLPLIKRTMENPPIEKLFNIRLDIPLIADCKVGKRWGGAKELTEEQVQAFDLAMLGELHAV